MKKRVITGLIIGVVYIATLLLTIYIHSIFFDIFMLFVAIVGGLEMSKALAHKFGRAEDVIVVLNTLLGYAAFYIVHNTVGINNGGISAYFGVLALMFLTCVIYTMISKKRTMRNAVSTMIVMIYPISILVYMLGINYLGADYRIAGLLLIFIVSSFTDTFAYIVGSLLKGPKLCPKISPKKTVSGAIGGILGGILGAALVLLCSVFGILEVAPLSHVIWKNVVHFLILGFGGSIFNQVGDLIASYAKRSCGIKDFGNLLPGHGGVLDRIDGLMVNAVFVFVYLMVIMI